MKKLCSFNVDGMLENQKEELEIITNPSDKEFESHRVNGTPGLANIGDNQFAIMPPYAVNAGYSNVKAH